MKNHVHVHSSIAITIAPHIVSRNSANWDLLLNSFGSHWAMSSPPGGYDDSIITSAVKFSKWTFEADLETKLPTRFEAIGTINPFLKKKAGMKNSYLHHQKMLGCGHHFFFKKGG